MNEEIKPIIAEMKEILNKYPDRQREILLYVFGRDNLMRIINEPTYEQLQEMHKTMARYALENEAKIDKLQSTLEEIREYIKEELKGLETTTDKITHCLSYQDLIDEYNNVLQIIDKSLEAKDE